MSERFNVFWFLSLLAPGLIMYIAFKIRTKLAIIGLSVISLSATYGLCVLAVIRKWELREASAYTTPNQMEYAIGDGANLIFTTYLSAPLEAVLWTVLWGYIWYHVLKVNKKSVLKKNVRI